MIIVREYFVAKPGKASKLAKMLKEAMKLQKGGKSQIMTDLTGEFNTVVMVTELESLAAMEKRMEEYGNDEAVREKMKGYTDMYITGGREIYRVVS